MPEEQYDPFAGSFTRQVTQEQRGPADPDAYEELTFEDAWQETNYKKFIPFIAGLEEGKEIYGLYEASVALENGTSTQEQREMLAAMLQHDKRSKSLGYKVGQIVFNMPAFLGEFVATGGVATAGRKAVGLGLREAIEKSLKKQGKENLFKGLSEKAAGRQARKEIKSLPLKELMKLAPKRTAGATVEAITQLGAIEATSQGLGAILPGFSATGRVENATWRRSMAQVDLTSDEAGNLGLLFLRNSREFMDALPEGIVESLIEVGSEKTGAAFKDLGRVLNKAPLLSKLGAAHSKVAEWFVKKYPSLGPSGMIGRVFKDAGYDGIIEEYMEERAGSLMQAGVGAATGWDGFQTMTDVWPGVEQSLAELIAFSVLPVGGAIVAPKHGTTKGDEILKIVHEAKKKLTEEEAAAATAELAGEIETGLGSPPVEGEKGFGEGEGFDEAELHNEAVNALLKGGAKFQDSGASVQATDMSQGQAQSGPQKDVESALRQRGLPVTWIETESAIDLPGGFIRNKEGTVTGIALSTHLADSVGVHGVYAVAMHEAFHGLKESDPDLWNKVVDLAGQVKGGPERLQEVVEEYKARLGPLAARQLEAGGQEAEMDEAVANAVQELGPLLVMMSDPGGPAYSMVRDALKGTDRGVLQRLLDWVKDTLGGIYGGEDYVPAYTRRGIANIQDMLSEAGAPEEYLDKIDSTSLELADIFKSAFDGMVTTEVARRVDEAKKPKPEPKLLGEPALRVTPEGTVLRPGDAGYAGGAPLPTKSSDKAPTKQAPAPASTEGMQSSLAQAAANAGAPLSKISWSDMTVWNEAEQRTEKSSGSSFFVSFGQRKIALVEIDGVAVPFYLSTGAGKKGVPPGKWYPFFGIGADGWINKTNSADILKYYGSGKLRSAAQALDGTVGDIRSDTSLATPVSENAVADHFTNALGFTPAENDGTADTKVRANIDLLLARLGEAGKAPAAEPALKDLDWRIASPRKRVSGPFELSSEKAGAPWVLSMAGEEMESFATLKEGKAAVQSIVEDEQQVQSELGEADTRFAAALRPEGETPQEIVGWENAKKQLYLQNEELKRLVAEGYVKAYRFGDGAVLDKRSFEKLKVELEGEPLTEEQAAEAEVNYQRRVEARKAARQRVRDEMPRFAAAPAVKTPEFREWFKDSKVVDDAGKPLVVYHGTDQTFTEFDPDRAIMGQHWFTTDRASIDRGEVGAAGKGVVMEVFLSLQNPAGWAEYDKYSIDELISLGYDGLALEGEGETTYVAFEPNQIKSATGNTGAFDPTQADIRFAAAPEYVEGKGFRLAAAPKAGTPEWSQMLAGMSPDLKNPDGSPRRWFHGTRSEEDFVDFRRGIGGLVFATRQAKFAEEFALGMYDFSGGRQRPRVMDLYVAAKKVWDFRNPAHVKELWDAVPSLKDKWTSQEFFFDSIQAESEDMGEMLMTDNWGTLETPENIEAIFEMLGYDAMLLTEMDVEATEPVLNIAVQDPSLFKVAEAPEAPETRFAAAPATNTPEFRAWFKDSEVVDEAGKPRVMYHGSKQVFTTFDPAGRLPGEALIFFSKDRSFASRWAERSSLGDPQSGWARREGSTEQAAQDAIKRYEQSFDWDRAIKDDAYREEVWEKRQEFKRQNVGPEMADVSVYPVYLSVQNLFDPRIHHKQVEQFIAGLGHGMDRIVEDGHHKRGNWIVYENSAVVQEIKRLGYDGMLLAELSGENDPHDTIAVFSSNQAKSAIGNVGTFDPAQADIRFAAAPTGVEDAPLVDDLTPKQNRSWLQKNLTAQGNMDEATFRSKLTRDFAIGALMTEASMLQRDLGKALRSRYGDELNEEAMREINSALAGEIFIDQLHPDIRGQVFKMRNSLDRLSIKMIELGVVDEKLVPTIEKNLGAYLHRSYRVFDDPDWLSKLPREERNELLNKAAAWIRTEYEIEHGKMPTNEEVETLMSQWLRPSAAEDGPAAMMMGGKMGRKDMSIFKRRKGIPAEIRALWGEYKDPMVNYTRSIAKMANNLANHKFLTDIRATGLELGWLNEGPSATHSKEIKGDNMKPLAGLYAEPDMYDTLIELYKAQDSSTFARMFYGIQGATKFSKTVLSVMTNIRNLTGNVGFAMANGHWNIFHTKTAIQTALVALKKGGTAEQRETYLRLQRLGVVGQSTNQNELVELLNDASKRGLDTVYEEGVRKRAKQGFDFVTDLYGAEDDVWKVYAFFNERGRYASALPELSDQEIDEKVAEIIRNTYPTYSMVPELIQKLRRFPIFGTFVSFPWEVVRTTSHTARLIAKELADPALRTIGMRRAMGSLAAGGSTYALAVAARAALGMDADDDDDMRRFLPPWQENSQLIPIGYDDDGNLKFIDISYTDPHSLLRKPVLAALQGGNITESSVEAMKEVLAPFFGEEILAGAGFDIARNTKKTGGQVYNPEDNIEDIASDIIGHLYKAMEPGTLTSMRRIDKGLKNYVESYGRTYDAQTEAMALYTGVRVQTMDPAQGLYWSVRKFNDRRSGVTRILTQKMRNKGAVAPEELSEAYETMETNASRLFHEIMEDVSAARRMGMQDTQIRAQLQAAGMPRSLSAQAVRGIYLPWTPSRNMVSSILKSADNDEQRREFTQRIVSVRQMIADRRQNLSQQQTPP